MQKVLQLRQSWRHRYKRKLQTCLLHCPPPRSIRLGWFRKHVHTDQPWPHLFSLLSIQLMQLVVYPRLTIASHAMFRNIPETPPTQPLYSGDLICYDSVTKEKPTSVPHPLRAHLTTTVTILICLYHHSSSTETVKYFKHFSLCMLVCNHACTVTLPFSQLYCMYNNCIYIYTSIKLCNFCTGAHFCHYVITYCQL